MTVSELMATKSFPTLLKEVEKEVLRLQESTSDLTPILEKEKKELTEKIQGWIQSLSNFSLGAYVRATIEKEMEVAISRQKEIELELDVRITPTTVSELVNPRKIAEALSQLEEVMTGGNATRVNLELSQHIDRIDCDRNGKVVIRTCRLGALAPIRTFIQECALIPSEKKPFAETPRIKKQRRRRLLSEGFGNDPIGNQSMGEFAADPDRFAGLSDLWFSEDVYFLPDKTPWYKQNALIVAHKRAEMNWSYDKLCAFFGKSEPTIRQAVSFAAELDPELANIKIKISRPKWEDTHYKEVEKLSREGLSLSAIGRELNISSPMVKKALQLAKFHSENQADA